MTFSELQLYPTILKAVTECGYSEPTPIQQQAIPAALEGKDLIASAQTGTGKTAAFMLPVLQKLCTQAKNPKGAPRVLVLTPTRELAGQVTEATRSYGKYVNFRSTFILGGVPYRNQFRDLSRPIDLVVGTPGRLLDHVQRGSLNLSRVEILILDEADRMLDMGFQEDMEKIIAKTPQERQTLLFTATMDNSMAKIAGKMLTNPERIDIAGKKNTLDTIEQRLHVADSLNHKQRLLEHLAADKDLTQAIVFSATKRDADSLARELSEKGHKAAAMHGDMTQGARNRTLRRLREGRVRLLVATDVAARGLDVQGISHVINFDLPQCAEDYVHRIGRTGRAGATGIAISFASRADVPKLQRIEKYIGSKVPMLVIPGLEPMTNLAAAQRKKSQHRSGGPVKKYSGAAKGAKPTWTKGTKPAGPYSGKPRPERRVPVVEYR
ncbi:MAG: DEAD/DEAH box helicase [Desulfuromonadales bacterium]|nr:DEAD/DEAH box helicase [Desulfuromonadales bacterium]